LCRAVLPALGAGNGSYIVNISIVGLPFSGLYCARKFAREGMSESLRLETRPFGIHVVLVEPGDFRTQITAKRCVAEASQNSAYRTAFDKFKQAGPGRSR
jgi:NAD(P)-dependent dehydrogenase (short-subunit alcohol dehydrogenase family)